VDEYSVSNHSAVTHINTVPTSTHHSSLVGPELRAMLRRLRRQAARHADAGRISEALDCQLKVITLAPDDPHEFMQLGYLHRKADELSEATKAFEQALYLAPHNADPHEALAELYLEMSRFDECIRECKAVLRLIPSSMSARQILSSAYYQVGHVEDALNVTQEMVRLAPLDPVSHYKSGMLLQQQGHWRAALEEFVTVTRISPVDSIEHSEAESAIEMMDRHQIGIIMNLLADDRLFQMRVARNAAEATQERGFFLTFDASLYLQHVAQEHEHDAQMFGQSLTSRPMMYN
jgi:tetratricopeptide (TPR) repeat protein